MSVGSVTLVCDVCQDTPALKLHKANFIHGNSIFVLNMSVYLCMHFQVINVYFPCYSNSSVVMCNIACH